MALILYSEANKVTANAYIDQTYMTAYLADRIPSSSVTAYNALTTEQDAYIIFATQRIDMFNFIGDRADAVQRLSFPRSNIYIDDYMIDDTTIPDAIERATAEMVLFLLENDINEDNTKLNIKRKKIDVIETEYMDNQVNNAANNSLNSTINGLIQPFLFSQNRVMKG
jgi:hypothetical protein